MPFHVNVSFYVILMQFSLSFLSGEAQFEKISYFKLVPRSSIYREKQT